MNEPLLHILVCTNQRLETERLPSCGPNGGATLFELFRDAVGRHGLATTVKVTATGCLTPCLNGPNLVIYPEGVWYCQVEPSDVDEILKAHLAGKTVTRLLLPKNVRVL